jgi:phosphatidylserine decarboxylase
MPSCSSPKNRAPISRATNRQAITRKRKVAKIPRADLTGRATASKLHSLMRWQTLSEARWIFVVLLLLALLSLRFAPWVALVFVILLVYTFAFFRDPERAAPSDPDVVVAAADGVVVEIAELEESEVVRQTMRRVAIFLSVFDVHTNRAPIDGRIIYRERRKGLCLDARNPECSRKNESMTWAFKNPRATLVVRQLTGAIARRIVGWSEVGDSLSKGERFGMIRFGSRTEVFLPLDATILVKVGDRVRAGSSAIAKLA